MTIDVLLIVDSSKRELFGINRLINELQLKNLKCRITGRHQLSIAYNQYNPKVVVIPKTHKTIELKDIHKKSLVCLLQAESFAGNAEAARKYNSKSNNAQPEFVDYVYCWGQRDYEAILKARIYPEGVLQLTGNATTEQWYCNNKNTTKKNTIGIATSLRAITHFSRPKSIIELIDSIEKNGESGFFDKPNHAESYLTYEIAFLRIILNIINSNPKYTISIRPHPLEDISHYNFLLKYPNVKIEQNSVITDWLTTIDVLCSYLSVSQIDAYAMKIPVISLKNMFPKWLIDMMPKSLDNEIDTLFQSPYTIKEFQFLIENIEYEFNEKATKFMKDVYNYPSEIIPSKKIAAHIKSILINTSKIKDKNYVQSKEKGFTKYVPEFFSKYLIVTFASELKCLFTGSNKMKNSYSPWRLIRNYQYEKKANNLNLKTKN
jgi:surface carbohydrate biosynthesis protein